MSFCAKSNSTFCVRMSKLLIWEEKFDVKMFNKLIDSALLMFSRWLRMPFGILTAQKTNQQLNEISKKFWKDCLKGRLLQS